MILKEPTVVIVNGVARNIDLFGVCVIDTRDRITSPDSSFFAVWHNNKWSAGKSIPSRIVSLSTLGSPANHFILLDENGEVFILGGGLDNTEQIVRDINFPLTNVVNMNGHAYVVGMGRQVYTRKGDNNWISIHGNMLSKEPEKLFGLQTIIQTQTQYLYAAGWHGEIWFYDGFDWSLEDSPTNFILSSSALVDDDSIMFCGRNGTMVVGKTGAWRIMCADSILDDLWSVVNYDNNLYFSSQSHIYRLDGEDVKQMVIEVEGYRGTHYSLQVVGNYLFSFGEHDVLTYDGKEWFRIPTE